MARMRSALWPDTSADEHRAEMDEYSMPDAKVATFVAVHHNETLGGFLEAGLRPYADGCHTKPVSYIEGWYVDEDLRKQGVGGELVKAAEQWAMAQGCKEMASDCLVDNAVSFKSHLALGYEEAERLIHFRKNL
jgi:aminoglycoside 6'-N-acetyltransferase I